MAYHSEGSTGAWARFAAPSRHALRTNLPPGVSALAVWRRDHGRADIENRIKELGPQFGLCGRSFGASEAACHLATCAYNLCVGLQRRLGQPQRAELTTLRWRRFSWAAVFSHAAGQPTLKLAVASPNAAVGGTCCCASGAAAVSSSSW